MRTFFRWLVMVGFVLQFLTPSAHAAWQSKAAVNAEMAAEYISQLKAGAHPDRIDRPQLRHINNYQAKQDKKMLNQAMDEAEALARAGKREQIIEIEVEKRDSRRGKSTY